MIENTLVLWGFGLLGAALLLLVAEIFIPSGGIIGVTACLLAIAAVVAFWRVSWVWGVTSLLLELVLAPVAVNFMLRVMPHTPVGRQLILDDEGDIARRHAQEAKRTAEQAQALVGASGAALTDLRPVGTVEIEGTRIEALAEGGMIRSGTRVRVTSVEGSQVRVRAVS